ncbi:hypothetical protein ACLOJK_022726 [Asimina triloba]
MCTVEVAPSEHRVPVLHLPQQPTVRPTSSEAPIDRSKPFRKSDTARSTGHQQILHPPSQQRATQQSIFKNRPIRAGPASNRLHLGSDHRRSRRSDQRPIKETHLNIAPKSSRAAFKITGPKSISSTAAIMDQTVADQRPQTIKQQIENQALAKVKIGQTMFVSTHRKSVTVGHERRQLPSSTIFFGQELTPNRAISIQKSGQQTSGSDHMINMISRSCLMSNSVINGQHSKHSRWTATARAPSSSRPRPMWHRIILGTSHLSQIQAAIQLQHASKVSTPKSQ